MFNKSLCEAQARDRSVLTMTLASAFSPSGTFDIASPSLKGRRGVRETNAGTLLVATHEQIR